jgi:hypothetical protein
MGKGAAAFVSRIAGSLSVNALRFGRLTAQLGGFGLPFAIRSAEIDDTLIEQANHEHTKTGKLGAIESVAR